MDPSGIPKKLLEIHGHEMAKRASVLRNKEPSEEEIIELETEERSDYTTYN